jgi:N-formylglutamate amidohydrolase
MINYNYKMEDPILVERPQQPSLPLIVSSPHSGRNYSKEFIASSVLTPLRLRASEDSFVEEIFGHAPCLGAPFIKALFPRVFVDVNREPFELDPTMFSGPLPDYVTTQNSRISAGLGTIARVVSNGEQVYTKKLDYPEIENRINYFYQPYHQALETLIEETKKKFGYCILLDCHSMPSSSTGPRGSSRPKITRHVDIVLGDCHGTSCHPTIIDFATNFLSDLGFTVRRNTPFAGGFITRNYGKPREGVHSLQIELNRRLYMDEYRIERLEGIVPLTNDMTNLVKELGQVTNPNITIEYAAE